MTPRTIAAFDFDGTLTRRDSVVPFLRRVAGPGRLASGLAANAHRAFPALARRDRDHLRTVATAIAFTGLPVDELQRHADAYGRSLVRSRLRTDTVARLHWHREAGHLTVLVSASYEPYLLVVAHELGVDAVLATRLDVVDGVCTGRLDGPNCRGREKVTRLNDWLGATGCRPESTVVWAYGDSNGDRELLAFAQHPVWVRGALDSVAATS